MKRKILIVGVAIVVVVAAVGIALAARNVQVVAQTDQEWQTTRVEKIPGLGTTRSLEILPVFEEATSRPDLELEHGVSYLIKTDHANILLDVGMTPARLSRNMSSLHVSESDFDTVFITHLHPDHTGGPGAMSTNTLIAGDPALNLRGKRVYVPMAIRVANAEPIVATQPAKIAEGVATIGTIAFADWFMNPVAWQPNAEQALAVNVQGKGIVLITGCGHQTVEKMTARAQALFDAPIAGIVGGLHYQDMPREQVQAHVTYVSSLRPQLVAVSPHDSTGEAMELFRGALPDAYRDIQVGRTISFGTGSALK